MVSWDALILLAKETLAAGLVIAVLQFWHWKRSDKSSVLISPARR
jgi:hypothetical protein